VLREAANALPSGVGHVWLEGIAALPPSNEDDDGERAPTAVERLRRTIAAAEAVLTATPEYNGSMPGGLKNAVDWASRRLPDNAWRDTPVAVIGASTGISAPARRFAAAAPRGTRPVIGTHHEPGSRPPRRGANCVPTRVKAQAIDPQARVS
jgi:NAD(P)H-dependent FMN reductase